MYELSVYKSTGLDTFKEIKIQPQNAQLNKFQCKRCHYGHCWFNLVTAMARYYDSLGYSPSEEESIIWKNAMLYLRR